MNCELCEYHETNLTTEEEEFFRNFPGMGYGHSMAAHLHRCNAPQNKVPYPVCDGPAVGGEAPWWWRDGRRYTMCKTARKQGLRPPIMRQSKQRQWLEYDGDDGEHCGPEGKWFKPMRTISCAMGHCRRGSTIMVLSDTHQSKGIQA